MSVSAHTVPAILDLLQRGLAPITDNEDALVELGFARAYPQVRRGYDATIWERTIDHRRPASDGLRHLARQRAFLEREPAE